MLRRLLLIGSILLGLSVNGWGADLILPPRRSSRGLPSALIKAILKGEVDQFRFIFLRNDDLGADGILIDGNRVGYVRIERAPLPYQGIEGQFKLRIPFAYRKCAGDGVGLDSKRFPGVSPVRDAFLWQGRRVPTIAASIVAALQHAEPMTRLNALAKRIYEIEIPVLHEHSLARFDREAAKFLLAGRESELNLISSRLPMTGGVRALWAALDQRDALRVTLDGPRLARLPALIASGAHRPGTLHAAGSVSILFSRVIRGHR